MYHIANDKRAVCSAQKIGNGLLNCLEHKSFAEITVTDVQKSASVGRATFYRLFDNISDVLAYLCDGVFECSAKEFCKLKSFNADDTTLAFIKVWFDNEKLLQAIVDSNRQDILYQSHVKYLAPFVSGFFKGIQEDDEQTTYLMTTLTACVSALMIAWLKNGGKESAEQLHERMKNCFKSLGEMFE